MVFCSRREINRMRASNTLGMLLGLVVLASVAHGFSQSNQIAQLFLVVIGLVALATIAIALFQILTYHIQDFLYLMYQILTTNF